MTNGYSVEERAAIVRKYAGSGMTLKEFACWAGLPASRLRSWLETSRRPEEVTWVEVVVECAEPQSGEAGGVRC